MARGGRGGGGSRGGGGRSGGRSGSSRRSGGSSFRSSRGSSYGGNRGGYGGGPSHHGPHHGPHHSHHYHGPRHHHHYHGSSRGGSIVGSILASIIVFTIIAIVVFQHTCTAMFAGCTGAFGGVGGTSSTTKREKLDRNLVNLTEWYTDELGWIEYEADLIEGMEDFYEDTGIQPHLYLVDWNGSITENEMHTFAEEAYSEFFTDEGHILVCYFSCAGDSIDYVGGEPYLLCGTATETIMDSEAQKIFWAEEGNNYENDNLYFEEYWGETFKDTGNRIMAAPIPWTTVAIVIAVVVGVIVVVLIIKKIVKANIAQKNKEQEDLERMLDKPLETFGDDAVEDLKDKYDNL